MSDSAQPGNPDLSLLYQLFSSATHDAAAVMCRWTRGNITLTLDEVREIPLYEVASELGIGDDMLTMVVLTLDGDVGGELILAFDDLNGRKFAAALLGRAPLSNGEWTDMERSALCETGNILGCAYVNALTRLVGDDLVPSPPFFVQDFGASVLEQALVKQATTSDNALICRTTFARNGEPLNWHLFFVPTQSLRDRMFNALLVDR